ncbi:hypothetical protein CERSUDRAFT_63408 [Gelatoporia subvermispora B]|uniref:CxC2-like cysteine cluster KDZ transposase-associated domain-containing protein n=1 Tax=Ceriporiopsis subvermispora (strain B) TaxID=914234 RepID=M2R5K9_CERS8|nr:hypothetical protein CERSUDRAFT_63408 [Gelatoporia subvermispora B]
MAVLHQFHSQNLQGNITAYDFYRSLENLMDSRHLTKLPDRLPAFMTVIREWRNIKMLKRGGRAHDPTGVAGTMEGSLAVQCRACPHPNKNLPSDWQKADPATFEIRFKYNLFVSKDCNFRLKGRSRKSKITDVTLSPGWSYYIEHSKYMEHISRFMSEDEISTCSTFKAVNLANLKKSKTLSATGVAAASCSRHETFRPNGLGDLQRGERFCNVDYVFLSSILGIVYLTIIASYDIACEYFKKFWTRMPALPSQLHMKLSRTSIIPKINKAHLVGHGEPCQGPYSYNYRRGVGYTDGEGCERCWPGLNKVAPSVKEMGPSSRRETIDDFCGYADWKKMVGLG